MKPADDEPRGSSGPRCVVLGCESSHFERLPWDTGAPEIPDARALPSSSAHLHSTAVSSGLLQLFQVAELATGKRAHLAHLLDVSWISNLATALGHKALGLGTTQKAPPPQTYTPRL